MRNIKNGLKIISNIEFILKIVDMKVVTQLFEKIGNKMSPFKVSVNSDDITIDTITNEEIDNMFNETT